MRLHNEVPGIVVPEPVQEALREAGARAPEVGLELARELLDEAREKSAGVYVIPPFKQPEAALDLLRLANAADRASIGRGGRLRAHP